MRIAILPLLVLVLLPSAFAIGLRIPSQFDNTTIIYTNQTKSVVIHIINDVEAKNSVTFFADSPTSNLLINGVQRYSLSFAMASNQQKIITIQLTGLNATSVVSVDYGFTVGDNSSSGIGFQQVTKNSFDAKVVCNGPCPGNQTGTVPKNTPKSTGGGSGGGALPSPIRNLTGSNGSAVPVISDITGDSAGVDQGTSDEQVAGAVGAVIPLVNGPKAANIVQSTTKGGESVALILMALLVFLMGFGTVTYVVLRRTDL